MFASVYKICFFFVFVFGSLFLSAQETNNPPFVSDTIPIATKKSFFKKGHDPAKAALLSAALPGAGQVYNKKYWKVPIVYAGLGGLSYLVAYSATEWKGYTDAYRMEVDGDTLTIGNYRGFSGSTQLLVKRKQFKSMLDLSAISLTVWYLLNIVDATVDAHLMHFDVNEDISVSIAPDIMYQPQRQFNFEQQFYAGIKVKFNLKQVYK
jgi:hypothetical protein